MGDQTKGTCCSLPHPEKDSFLSALPAMAITTPEAEVGPLFRVLFSHLVQEAQVIFSMSMASVTCFPRGTSCTWRL